MNSYNTNNGSQQQENNKRKRQQQQQQINREEKETQEDGGGHIQINSGKMCFDFKWIEFDLNNKQVKRMPSYYKYNASWGFRTFHCRGISAFLLKTVIRYSPNQRGLRKQGFRTLSQSNAEAFGDASPHHSARRPPMQLRQTDKWGASCVRDKLCDHLLRDQLPQWRRLSLRVARFVCRKYYKPRPNYPTQSF